MTKNDIYVAVLGDAVASRTLAAGDRAALQAALREALAQVNRKWKSAIAARFAITLGDQFEGLLHVTAPLWEIVHVLRAALRAHDWVVVAARGEISTPLARTALEVDGPCLHAARDALEAAKGEGRVLAFAGFPQPVEALARYYSALYSSWTARQREVAALLRTRDAAEAATELGIDRSAVSHLSRRMRWPLVAAADSEFRLLLEAR